MIDPAIIAFFTERKNAWLKKNIKAGMDDSEQTIIRQQCEDTFSLETWLPNAAKRAGQMSFSTHPCTFSHPSARKNKNGYVTSIIAENHFQPDGYLRTGNVDVKTDVLGNAAVIDVYKFLSIITEDGRSLRVHLCQDSALAKALLDIKTESYQQLKAGFMEMVTADSTIVTSSKIKQVYFPVDNQYHLLSIISNSGIIFALREQIDKLHFSDAAKVERDLRSKNHYSESGYLEIRSMTTMGYGGTKPQNISILNNQHGGRAYLLLSVPPILEKRKSIFPKKDFFSQSLRYYDCKETLMRLDNILRIEHGGNISLDNIRKGRDRCLFDILDVILQKMMHFRGLSNKQFYAGTSSLPIWQQIWLCSAYIKERESQDDWLDTLCQHITLWINNAYKHTIKNPALLGKAERSYIKNFIEKNKEVLR